MLEIFTKEVPYRECSNPAQIYKRVISGIELQSLGALGVVPVIKDPKDCIEGDGQICYRPKETEKNSDDQFKTYMRPCIKIAMLSHSSQAQYLHQRIAFGL
jgi:hypothetical protein